MRSIFKKIIPENNLWGTIIPYVYNIMKTLICSLFTALLLAAPATSQRGPESHKPLNRPSHSVKDFERKQANDPRKELKALRKEVEALKKEVAMLKRAMRMRGAKTEGKAPQGRRGRPGREGRRGGRQVPEGIKKKILERVREHKGSKKIA
jgi:hypothetical protein